MRVALASVPPKEMGRRIIRRPICVPLVDWSELAPLGAARSVVLGREPRPSDLVMISMGLDDRYVVVSWSLRRLAPLGLLDSDAGKMA